MTESKQLRGGGGYNFRISMLQGAIWPSEAPDRWLGFRTTLTGRHQR